MRALKWTILWWAVSCLPAYSGTVSQVPTITGPSPSLRNLTMGANFDDVFVATSYSAMDTQGGGTFVRWGTGTCSVYPGGDDGGVVIESTNGTGTACYVRQFSGAVHLKWYGIVMDQDVVGACSGTLSTNCLTNAFTAARTLGYGSVQPVVDTDGLRIRSSASIQMPANERLTCGAPFTGLIAASNYATATGAIILDHSATINIVTNTGLTQNADQVELDHCIVLTDGRTSGVATINLNPTNHSQVIANNAAMVSNSDTGISCDGAEQPYIHDVTVIGFDTGISSFNCGRFRLEHANIDADVPVYLANGQSVAHLSHISAQAFLSKGVTDRNGTYSASKITPGAAGACRVELSGSPDVHTGDYVYLNGDGNYHTAEGVLGCEGLHVVSQFSATQFDLVGTNCPPTDCYNSGGSSFLTTNASWAINSQVLHVDSTSGVHANELVTSSDTGVFNGYSFVKVVSVSPYTKTVVIDHFTKDVSSVTTPPTVSFTNTGGCSLSGCGLTLYDFGAVHIAAGNSLGGLATNHLAACIRAGGPGDTSALGILADDIFCGQFQIEYDLRSADPFVCTGCGFDNEPKLADDTQIAALYGPATKPLALSGSVDSHNTKKVNGFTITGTTMTSITAQHAGWFVGYEVYKGGSDIGSISNVNPNGLTITLTASAGTAGEAVDLTIPYPSQEDTGAADFVGTDFGSGGGVIVDAPNGYCNAMQGGIVKPNATDILAVEFVHGCANINLSTNKNNNVLVGASAGAGSSMIGSNLPSGTMVFENAALGHSFGALGNYFGLGGQANTASFGANSSCPASSDTTVLVLCGGGAQGSADNGNGYSQCNPNYSPGSATGCIQYGMNSAGSVRMLDSSKNPVSEFKDSSHMQLNYTYQDGIVANSAAGTPPTLAAGINVVASCVHTGCAADKVKLPLASNMVDAAATPSGSSCASSGVGNCGAAGGVTIINKAANSITIATNGSDTVSTTTLASGKSITFWPVTGVGWVSP